MGVLNFIAAGLFIAPLVVSAPSGGKFPRDSFVNQTTCAGQTFTYEKLAGYGALPSNVTDKFGDTISTGSSIAIDKGSWKVKKGKIEGTIYVLPDRGWNTEGTSAYQPRIHEFKFTFTPNTIGEKNLIYKYEDTILFADPNGKPTAGLDPTTALSYDGFPNLPAAAYTGNGFGGEGPGGTRVCLDTEGLVLDTVSKKGGFWISDEYGPFIYHFTKKGKMDVAIRPPDALIPIRKSKENYASDNPPIFNTDQHPDPIDPESGRSNNQGFEGLTYSEKENALYVMLQSASINDGGLKKTSNRYTRLLRYKLDKSGLKPKLDGEWVVPLPTYEEAGKDKPRTAAQSEILSLENGKFLVLSRDGNGRGQDDTKSVYRQVDVFSIEKATNIKGKYDSFNSSYAPGGKLDSSITAAEYCKFVNFNVDSELAKFGLVNGGEDSEGLLNEKWEGLALMPIEGEDGAYWLFASSDNDFVTQDGHQNFGKDSYKDSSGFDLLNQVLVFKITIK